MTILTLENYAIGALSKLKAETSKNNIEITQDPKKLSDAEILLIRSRTKIDEYLIKQAPKLKLVVSATAGFDHMDWQLAQKHGITCAHVPDANAHATAELTLTLILTFEREILQAHKNVRNNQWRDGLNRPHGLENKTLGIIGLGRVGSKVAQMAKPFGAKLLGHDPYIDQQKFKDLQVEPLGFTELLRASDIVTLHVPLTKETKHLLNQPTFQEMQSDAVLINTCRGAVVDENDLMTALDNETIKGAAMDVIEREPPPKGHRLLTHPRLLLTPHIGAFTENAWEKSSQAAVEQVLKYLKGEKVENSLPLSSPWFQKT